MELYLTSRKSMRNLSGKIPVQGNHKLPTNQSNFFLHITVLTLSAKLASVVSDSMRPHRWQPTSPPGKNTGVGCHFLLQCMKVKSESEVTHLCPTLHNHVDCGPPGSSVHGIFPGKSTRVGCHCLLLKMITSGPR